MDLVWIWTDATAINHVAQELDRGGMKLTLLAVERDTGGLKTGQSWSKVVDLLLEGGAECEDVVHHADVAREVAEQI